MSANHPRRSAAVLAKDKRKSVLENLKKARNAAGSRTELHNFDDEDDVYDLVDQDEYEKIVEERRKNDAFVVDDEGLGYADDGEEHVGVVKDTYEEKLGERGDENRTSKKIRKANRGGDTTQKNTMFSFVRTGPSVISSASSMDTPAEDLDIESLLGDFVKPTSASRNTRPSIMSVPQPVMKVRTGPHNAARSQTTRLFPSRNHSYIPRESYEDSSGNDADVPQDYSDDHQPEDVVDAQDNLRTGENATSNESKIQSSEPAPVVREQPKISLTKTNKKLKISPVVSNVPAQQPFVPVLSTTSSANTDILNGLAEIKEVSGLVAIGSEEGGKKQDAESIDPRMWLQRGEDGQEYVPMYWTDGTDINGVLYLFGKIPVQTTSGSKKFESCCVAVHGMLRNLFVLAKATGDITSDGKVERAGMIDVHRELSKVLVPSVIPKEAGQGFRCKPVQRNYAFEFENVPREMTDYLKVVYPAKFNTPSPSVCAGEGLTHIERIFGASSSILELFLLKRKLMGPCWIRINNPRMMPDQVSWCRIEIGVESPKLISKINNNDCPPTPPLVAMAVSLKTAVNPVTHVHEVMAISAVLHTKVDMEGESEAVPQQMKRFVMVRQLGNSCGSSFPSTFPHNLQAEAVKASGGTLALFTNEHMMLLEFFQRLHVEDPDLLASHNLFGFEFDVLIMRAVANKIPTWSKIGRLRKTRPPKSISDRDLAAGRLLCDTYKASKEFLRETTYSLTHLAQSQLRVDRVEVDPVDVPKYFGTAQDIIRLSNHTAWDSLLVLRLMLKLQIVPLTKQLTNLSGNLWARTMRGARAERIEFLLLHEFHSLKFILPEKKPMDNKKIVKAVRDGDEDADDGDDGKVGGHARVRGKAAYAGGLVLEPKKGLYDTFILLLDFNSLYPSLIQEYNLCFTTIEWTKYMGDAKTTPAADGKKETAAVSKEEEEVEDDDEDGVVAVDSSKSLPPVPESSLSQGVLPRVIRHLVERRKQVKQLLKKEKDPALRQQYDIKQKALKLTANSMYGCLGFTFSRFYARPIAALVTAMGREALQRTVDLATNKLGLEVIYGDTDSVMINTGSTDLVQVKDLGHQVTKEVNKLYRCLELDIDGIFKSMLLLKKKKYAALSIKESDNGIEFEKEMKGLDLVRRDWCPLSKETGKYVVDQILSGKGRDDIVNEIHEFLGALATRVRENKEPLEKFVITKGLNKNPKDYPDCKGQPHLQVALQMIKNSRPVNIGDHIPYVICSQGPEGATPAQRAYHPDEVIRSNGGYTIDVEWYLSNQILPPISRLCEPIDGTSQAQLASQLGLDASRFSSRTNFEESFEDGWGFTPRCLMDDSERFKSCKKLMVKCKSCQTEHAFSGPFSEDGRSGLLCSECGRLYWGRNSAADLYCYISNRLTKMIRECIKQYYDYCLVCDDPTCNKRTMQHPSKGLMCTENCHGRLVQEYDEAALHTQLKYFESLFDFERFKSRQQAAGKQVLEIQDHKHVLSLLKQHLGNTINGSAYNWIRPSLWTHVCGRVPGSAADSSSHVEPRVAGLLI